MSDADEDRAKGAALPEGDLVRILFEQHAAVRDLLAEVAAASGTDRKKLFAQLTAMVKAHETAEEAVVRPVTMQTAGGDVAEARNAEESEADAAVAALSQLDVDSPEFDSRFAAFTAAVSTHADAEESDEFPTLQSGRSAEQRQQLGREFLAEFAAAGGVG
jgi:hemerythrin superfamily protein